LKIDELSRIPFPSSRHYLYGPVRESKIMGIISYGAPVRNPYFCRDQYDINDDELYQLGRTDLDGYRVINNLIRYDVRLTDEDRKVLSEYANYKIRQILYNI
jgi:hypothetical protein